MASAALTRLDTEIRKLRDLAATMEVGTLEPSIEALERKREALVTRAQERAGNTEERVIRMMPAQADSYRAMVARLCEARELLSDADFREVREIVFEFLGGAVPVIPQANGDALLKLAFSSGPILLACKSDAYNLVAGAGFEPATFGL